MYGYFRVVLFGLLVGGSAISNAQNPELTLTDGYSVQVPLVDYAGKAGFYHKAIFKYQPTSDSWKLLAYAEGVPLKFVNAVQVILGTEIPTQVFLKITGLYDDCSNIGDAVIRKDGSSFSVYAYYTDSTLPPGGTCAGKVVPFTKVVPLPVYGLAAGTYSYSVNNQFMGTFTLNESNVIAN